MSVPLTPSFCQPYPRPEYQIYGQSDRRSYHPQGKHWNSWTSGEDADAIYYTGYDDMGPVRDSYYPDERISPGGHGGMMPLPRRQRRHSSSVAFDMRVPPMDPYRRLSSTVIKLKAKGAYRSGLTIGDAQANVRLSGNDAYTFRDLNADMRGRIAMKIRVGLTGSRIFPWLIYFSFKWSGYPSLTYDIPLDGYGDRVNLQTLARRTARAVVHFLQVISKHRTIGDAAH